MRVLVQYVPNEIRTDESGAAGDEQLHIFVFISDGYTLLQFILESKKMTRAAKALRKLIEGSATGRMRPLTQMKVN